ncbi:MAG TPA: HAD family hydrolase [Solirubrobacteraceae bacterium]|nr:HAD family hydrolase [Solirubrobacteraceae bacterium]
MTPTILFDLDDTLIVEEPAAAAAFRAAAGLATADHPIDAAELGRTARLRARELWWAAPTHPYCLRVGISSWEGLWCRFEGDDPALAALRAWAPVYRREAWTRALADFGVDDDALADRLGDAFGVQRRRLHQTFPDAVRALTALRRSNRLGLITNGASCLQREKLAASGLAGHFDAIVVSGDLGTCKPDARVFRRALGLLDADPRRTTMVGDNLERDVDGAIAAGLDAIWLNRSAAPRPDDRPDLVEIPDLDALPGVLRRPTTPSARRPRSSRPTSRTGSSPAAG